MNPQVGAVANVLAFAAAPTLPPGGNPVRKFHRITDGPSAAELAEIEAEWPLIAAELDLLDAEINLINAADHGGPTALDWRRKRRAEAKVTRVAAELAAPPTLRKAVA
nr:hypothetical protein GCM10020092_088670 [Actinoplanes digitatis]